MIDWLNAWLIDWNISYTNGSTIYIYILQQSCPHFIIKATWIPPGPVLDVNWFHVNVAQHYALVLVTCEVQMCLFICLVHATFFVWLIDWLSEWLTNWLTLIDRLTGQYSKRDRVYDDRMHRFYHKRNSKRGWAFIVSSS